MVHQLEPSRSTLPPIEDWRTSDSRELLYTVTLTDGTGKDITNDTVEWQLLRKPYHAPSNALLTDDSDGVTLHRDGIVDPTVGEFRIDVGEDTLSEWGSLWQRVVVDPVGGSRQSWLGRVTVTARGGGDSV